MESSAFLTFRYGPRCSVDRYGLDSACSAPSAVHVAIQVARVWAEGEVCLRHATPLVHELSGCVDSLILATGMLEALAIAERPSNAKIAPPTSARV